MSSKPVSVLEIGCGAGDRTIWLAGKGFQASGIDFAESAVTWAREKAATAHLDATFVTASAVDLPFEASSFDWILDGNCWHCIIGDDRKTFLSEVKRVLKPGGLFTGNCSTYSDSMELLEGFDPTTRTQQMFGVQTHYSARPEEILAEVIAAGFSVERHLVKMPDSANSGSIILLDART